MRQRESQIRMEQLVEPNARGMTHDLLETAVAEVAADQTVAMVDPQSPALARQLHGAGVDRESQLAGQERAEPEIMVAVQVVDRDAGASQIGQRRQRGEVAARNRGAVFEPEVEEIADDVELRRATGQAGQKLVKPRLTGASRSAGSAPRWASERKRRPSRRAWAAVYRRVAALTRRQAALVPGEEPLPGHGV